MDTIAFNVTTPGLAGLSVDGAGRFNDVLGTLKNPLAHPILNRTSTEQFNFAGGSVYP